VSEIKSKPSAYTILLGDSIDLARTHYRNHVRSYRDDENSQEALDAFAREEVGKLARVLEPIKDRIWGIIRGNHYWEFCDGTNSEQYLCQLLGVPYLGALGLVRVNCKLFPSSSKTHNLTIFAHHSGGGSGARTVGGDVNQVTRQESTFDAHIYLLGHTHRRIAWKETVLALSTRGQPTVVDRTRVFARCGAFLKGFKDDAPNAHQPHRPSYAEAKALRPTDLGWVTIKVCWRSKSRGLDRQTKRKVSDVVYPEYTLEY